MGLDDAGGASTMVVLYAGIVGGAAESVIEFLLASILAEC